MIRQPVLYAILLVFPLFGASAQEPGLPVSFEQAVEMVNRDNKSIRIAEPGTELGQKRTPAAELFLVSENFGQRSLRAHGERHRSQGIAVGVHRSGQGFHPLDRPRRTDHHFAAEQPRQPLVQRPAGPRNVSTIDATVALPIFTGGKRIYAGRIGKSMVGAAR